jgi:hypothetical protein
MYVRMRMNFVEEGRMRSFVEEGGIGGIVKGMMRMDCVGILYGQQRFLSPRKKRFLGQRPLILPINKKPQ